MKNFHPTGNCPIRDILCRLVDWALEYMTGIFDSREKAGQPCG